MWVKVAQSCPTLGDSMDSPWNSPGQNTGVSKSFPSPGDPPNPGIEPRSSALQADSLPSEPPGNKGAVGLKKYLGIDYTLDKGKEKTLQPLSYLWLGEHQAIC